MARGATVQNFELVLSDVDRGVYDTLSLKLAQHPSESGPYLVTRLLAYALELEDGLTFTSGLASSDEPALWVRDLTDQLTAWIDIGCPEAARLHRASKAADRVAVYCHKPPGPWLDALARERVHEAERIALHAFDPRTIQELAEHVERRNQWSLSRVEGVLYIETERGNVTLEDQRLTWPVR
ncbi:MAG: YaeQ family protein [Deltaproteobacteria bacterium]|nr:MAG: YaeQ family protein [Deltaproteobacteria bacterium]